MSQGVPQVSFASGEISPNLYGRVDFQGYQNGLRTCRNFIVQKSGGVVNRPGTRFVSEVSNSANFTRLIPFEFSNDQSYVLELGNQTMRVIQNGALVEIAGAVTKAITGVTSGVMRGSIILAHASVQCVGHGFTNVDTVTITGVLGAVEANGTWSISVIDAENFYIMGPVPVTGFYSTLTSAYTSGGTANNGADGPLVVTTPWLSVDLSLLKFTQSNDVLTVCHPNYPPQQIERLGATSWRVVQFQPVNGPFLDTNIEQGKSLYVSASAGDITITADVDLFNTGHVGQMIRIEQPPDDWTPVWEVAQSVLSVGYTVKAGPNFYTAQSTGTTGTVRPSHLEGTQSDGFSGVLWRYSHSGYGIARITGFTDSKHVTATVLSRFPDSLVAGGTAYAITNLVNTGGAPNILAQCAHVFTVGDIVAISGGASIGLDGTYSILSQIVGPPASFAVVDRTTVKGFDGFVPIPAGITVSLGGAAHSYKWAFQSWGNTELYPAATSYTSQQRQVFAGTPGHPQTINMSRTAGFTDFGVGIPVLDDDAISLSIFSRKACRIKHLLELNSLIALTSGGIFAIKGGTDGVLTPATAQAPPQSSNSCSDVAPLKVGHFGLFVQEKGSQVRTLSYSLNEDSFIGEDITVLSDHLFKGRTVVSWAYQETPNSVVWSVLDNGTMAALTFCPEQKVTAWHRHDTLGSYEWITCITENSEDVVYSVVRRTIGGVQKRYIERMDNRGFTVLPDAYFVDCGLSYNGSPATVFSGLEHLEGQTVSILADGSVQPPQVVTGCAVSIPRAASVVHVGLPIVADLETLSLAQGREKQKNINRVTLLVNESWHIMAGRDADHLFESKQDRVTYDTPMEVSDEAVMINITSTWDKAGRVFVRQDLPLPIAILAAIPEVNLGGS